MAFTITPFARRHYSPIPGFPIKHSMVSKRSQLPEEAIILNDHKELVMGLAGYYTSSEKEDITPAGLNREDHVGSELLTFLEQGML